MQQQLGACLPQALFSQLIEVWKRGDSLVIEELWNAPKAFIAAMAQQATGKNLLILTAASKEEGLLYQDLLAFSNVPVLDFPAWETLPNENVAPSPDIVGERYNVLSRLAASEGSCIILGSLQACLQRLISKESFTSLFLTLSKGQQISFDTLLERLLAMGYKNKPIAADKGEFSVRGGIIDIFPVNSPDPARLEFWGDEITAMRSFDPIGQCSIRPIDIIQVTAAQELELVSSANNLVTLLDYLGDNTIVVFDDLLALEDRYATLAHMLASPTPTFSDINSFLLRASSLQALFFSQQPLEELGELHLAAHRRKGYYSVNAPICPINFQLFDRKYSAQRWRSPFLRLGEYFFPEQEEGSLISGEELLHTALTVSTPETAFHIVSSSDSEEEALCRRLSEQAIALPKQAHFHRGYLSAGLVIADPPIVVLPMTEITGRYKLRRQKLRSTYHTAAYERFDLVAGDIVVHLQNGIGRYSGIEKKADHRGTIKEFLVVEYADNGRLFVPVEQAHLLSKYIGADSDVPRMHTLGSTKWKTMRERTESAIAGYAQELLELYAARELKGGVAFREDSPEMIAFEEEFPFVETEDQLAAIAAVKADMLSPTPLDRLVCGDVGYGKTEVAMRAAFKAVVDGDKQVAVLVPTTVLAMQHYENFCERMGDFPVTIDVVSRYRTPKQVREAIEGVKSGSIDILIGTHRLLSADIEFKDLGLIVIDEEQRFGVKAKEHLKKIKTGVECLTLSATPIPRTLYMSLIGVRDFSVISTPPQDRLPIKTILTEPSDEIIRNALLRELSRDGQAYVIHNRVETIDEYAAYLQRLLPQARIAVAHGQMHADRADAVFHAYKCGNIDILVATTIIENGVDIPNANTILIDRADRFGMADLYQMRGRVGRWNRRAYAYFFVPKLARLPELSRKRLEALAASSGYGGGMKVAQRDMELRGAGDLLGIEQSGHVAAIGFHLYCKLLKRKILALQGKATAPLTETKLDVPFDARLPNEYIEEVNLRMDFYQRFGEATAFEEIDQLRLELIDRFGALPLPAQWLYHLARLQLFGALHGFASIKQEKFTVSVERKKGKDLMTHRFFLKSSATATPASYEAALIKELQSFIAS